MAPLRKLLLSATGALALSMAANSHAAFIRADAGYSGRAVAPSLRPVSGAATTVEGDDTYFSFTLPFAFTFYGRLYDAGYNGWISTNGLLGFNPIDVAETRQVEGYCCDGSYSSSSPLNTIQAGWFDLFGRVHVQTDGTAGSRQFVVTWDANEYDSNVDGGAGAPNRFQAILHETSNDIEFQYEQLNSLRHFATVGGIRGDDLSNGLSYVEYTENVQLRNLGLSIHFDPNDVGAPQDVPEPGSIALLGMALGAMALSRRKRKRAGTA